MKSIAQAVHFLAKQSLPMQGHHDDCQYLEMKDVNVGNFQELLKFHWIPASSNILKMVTKYNIQKQNNSKPNSSDTK